MTNKILDFLEDFFIGANSSYVSSERVKKTIDSKHLDNVEDKFNISCHHLHTRKMYFSSPK